MKEKYIPIIGTISAGKSTFLKAFLGVTMLQTGATTTTKFVCLIKNSNRNCFYHVIPNKNNGIKFIKDGEKTIGEEEIQKRIEEINRNLSEKKPNKNDIFYMLETPIKTIKNTYLLNNCYFMDIPGLNENNSTYIEDIFSLITINDILFEIMIFDSTSIGSDNILDIFKKLEKKNCLKKEKNLYILNKIDLCNNGKEDIIDSFKNYFYKEFEDEKIENPAKIKLNFAENYFIPMNSLLYEAEIKITEDFYSMLLFELFTFLEYNNRELANFFEFIKKRNESLIFQNDISSKDLEKNIKNINNEEMTIISTSIERIKTTFSMLTKKSNFQLRIKLENKAIKKEIQKLYLIHSSKQYFFLHTEYFDNLQDIINKIYINIKNDLCDPPCVLYSKKKILKENNSLSFKSDPFLIIKELDTFINESLNIIDQKKELSLFKLSYDILRENVLGRKIKVSFIGNISSGKSSVLNCIIGEQILPIDDKECTYRGVIIRHKNIDDYYLYRTKLVSKGEGINHNSFFIDENKPYCKGIQNIKSYLKNKNNDKIIKEEDAYIVITGRLKIFEFIKLEQNLINKIEFIDLPGLDRKNNIFNENQYYDKILKFSNVCIYINEPKTIDDDNSMSNIRNQYIIDKSKVFPNLRNYFNKSCLFLINKSDQIITEKEKEKVQNSLINNLKKVDNISRDNISFFSGKSFIELLENHKKYIYNLETNPIITLDSLYKDWFSNIFYFKSFSDYINERVCEQLDEQFNLELDDEIKIEVPENFNNNIKKSITILNERLSRKINKEEEKDIIISLYKIYTKFKTKKFEDTIYSHSFFHNLKNVIQFSNNLQIENLKIAFNHFFDNADEFFNKEIKKEKKNIIEKNNKNLEFIKKVLFPEIEKSFDQKEKKIKNEINLTKDKCIGIFNDELNNIDQRLRESNNDFKKALGKITEKINEEIKSINDFQKRELNIFLEEIQKLLEDTINKSFEKKYLEDYEIDINKKKILEIVKLAFYKYFIISLPNTELIKTAKGVLQFITFVTIIGLSFLNMGFGLPISILSIIFISKFDSNIYKNKIEQSIKELKAKFESIQNSFSSDFKIFKDSIISEVKIKIEILSKFIDSINKEQWEEIRQKYITQKKSIKEKIELNININN